MTDAAPYPPVTARNMFLAGHPVSGTCGNQLGYEEGINATSLLPGGLVSNFGENTVFKPGMLRFGYASAKTYPGFQNLSGNLAYSLRTEAVFDHARLTIPYAAAGLTEAQEAGIQVYRITDSGEYIALGASVDAVGKKVVSGEMDTFGRIMVAAPRQVFLLYANKPCEITNRLL